MSIDRILAAVDKSHDPEALKQLTALAGFYNQLYTVLITSTPAYEHERKWSAIIDQLTQIGNELITWLGGR